MDGVPGPLARVSVLVRTKDRPGLLAEALESLRAQTYRDFEVVLVNDGGTPPGPELLDPAPGRGLRLVGTQPPHGRARALNTGLAAARGRYVAYLDDDDLFLPDHLETLVRFLDGTDVYGAAYTDADLVLQELGEDGRYRERERRPAFGRDFDPNRLLYSNYVPLVCLMHRREAAQAAGGFDEAFDLFEDWDFLVRLSDGTRLHRIGKTTALYRMRDDGTNATAASPWLGARSEAARRQLFAKHAARRTPKTQIALIDQVDREMGDARWRLAKLEREIRRLEEVRGHLAAVEGELRAFRGDAARQLQAAGERESALRAERDALSQRLDAVNRSLVWRLFGPYWKLKALLGK